MNNAQRCTPYLYDNAEIHCTPIMMAQKFALVVITGAESRTKKYYKNCAMNDSAEMVPRLISCHERWQRDSRHLVKDSAESNIPAQSQNINLKKQKH
jgi:hypothetical protein